MNELEIRSAIQTRIGSTPYSFWTIGITDDCVSRRSQHEANGENCKHWRDWNADTEAIARRVETYFQARDMKRANGDSEHPTNVYVF